MRPKLTLILLAAGVLAGLAAGCASASKKTHAATDTDAPALLAAIHAAIGSAPCNDSRQCQSIAVGAKPCGGPEAYFAWSNTQTDGATLTTLVARHKHLREAQNAASGEASNCMMIKDPGAFCQISQGAASGTCQLRQEGSGKAD
ncbi:hypothetical protein BH11PSE12_BH11PSE12_06050 [soil metagenome]